MEILRDFIGLGIIYLMVDYKREKPFDVFSWDNFRVVVAVTIAYHLFKY